VILHFDVGFGLFDNQRFGKITQYHSQQDGHAFGSLLPVFLPLWIGLATSRSRAMTIRIEALKCIKVTDFLQVNLQVTFTSNFNKENYE
jgi:hypothetical protein